MSYIGLPRDDYDDAGAARPLVHAIEKAKSLYTIASAVLSVVAIITSLTTGLYVLIKPTAQSTGPHELHYQCGTSALEAQALGCHFDVMSFSWLPPTCFDEPLMEEFLAHNWTWSSDRRGEHPVPESDVRKGDFEYLYTNYRYHVVHCTYMWRKMHRALFTGDLSRIDGYIASIHHTKHCEEMLLDRDTDHYLWGVPGVTKFPSCGQGMLDKQPGWYAVHDGQKIFGMKKALEALFGGSKA